MATGAEEVKIIFMLPMGAIEWPVPDNLKTNFNFISMTTRVRMDGYFMSDTLYVRHENLIGMAFAPDEATAPVVIRKDLN